MHRSDIIDTRLTKHYLKGVGTAISSISSDHYRALPYRPEKRLGIYGPLPYPGPGEDWSEADPALLMSWSKAYLAEITADMDDSDLAEFLDAAIWLADMMIALEEEVPDLEERFATLEDQMLTEWPGSMELLNTAELKALDIELGPPEVSALRGPDGEEDGDEDATWN